MPLRTWIGTEPISVTDSEKQPSKRLVKYFSVNAIKNNVWLGPPAGFLWDVRSVCCLMSTTATVKSRRLALYIHGANTGVTPPPWIFRSMTTLDHGASLNCYYTWAKGAGDLASVTYLTEVHGLPDQLLYSDMSFQLDILNNDAGLDEVSCIVFGYEIPEIK